MKFPIHSPYPFATQSVFLGAAALAPLGACEEAESQPIPEPVNQNMHFNKNSAPLPPAASHRIQMTAP